MAEGGSEAPTSCLNSKNAREVLLTRDDLSIAAAASIRTCEVSRACCERRCSRCDVTAADSQMFQTDTLLEATAPTVTSSAPTHCSVYFYHATPEVQRKTAMSPAPQAPGSGHKAVMMSQ